MSEDVSWKLADLILIKWLEGKRDKRIVGGSKLGAGFQVPNVLS